MVILKITYGEYCKLTRNNVPVIELLDSDVLEKLVYEKLSGREYLKDYTINGFRVINLHYTEKSIKGRETLRKQYFLVMKSSWRFIHEGKYGLVCLVFRLCIRDFEILSNGYHDKVNYGILEPDHPVQIVLYLSQPNIYIYESDNITTTPITSDDRIKFNLEDLDIDNDEVWTSYQEGGEGDGSYTKAAC